MPRAALLDVDGTLVDSNYQHALAWYRAFRQSGIVLPLWRIHRHVGMGGDQLVPALVGEQVERSWGGVRGLRGQVFQHLVDEIEPLTGSRELIATLKERGLRVVLASSATAARARPLPRLVRRTRPRRLLDDRR